MSRRQRGDCRRLFLRALSRSVAVRDHPMFADGRLAGHFQIQRQTDPPAEPEQERWQRLTESQFFMPGSPGSSAFSDLPASTQPRTKSA